MQSRYVNGLTVRALRDGDRETVGALFARLGDRSRERRFCGAKPRRGIGSILASELAADARAAGITHLTATVCGENPRVIALLRRLGSLQMSWRGGERDLVIGL
jgi:hypothetical protein